MRLIKELRNTMVFYVSHRRIEQYDRKSFLKLIKSIYKNSDQMFGRGEFYQSLPRLNVDGQRPTDYRIEKYGINDVVKNHYNVLDIGCNVGFLDITIADMVNHITGIEYNKDLWRISILSRDYLNLTDKCDFVNSDFNDWVKKNKKKYDVVFSFAIHYWLGVTPKTYAEIIDDILLPNGYLFFESQNMNTVDKEFDEYVNEFLCSGLVVQYRGTIKDDDIIERKFLVFKKNEKQ